jgi:hypothetical protein
VLLNTLTAPPVDSNTIVRGVKYLLQALAQ